MRRKSTLTAALLAVTLAGVAPASAAFEQIDPNTKQPLIVNDYATGMGISPIPRETVQFSGRDRPGTIIVNTGERRLYYVLEGGKALRYGIGVGRDGFQWGGTHNITMKREWPDWRPPAAMLKRQPQLPRHMPGGPQNPLGARALYIGSTIFRIHGSNEPHTIGQAVSSGCFRMTNEDVVDLYDRVKVGARVVVIR